MRVGLEPAVDAGDESEENESPEGEEEVEFARGEEEVSPCALGGEAVRVAFLRVGGSGRAGIVDGVAGEGFGGGVGGRDEARGFGEFGGGVEARLKEEAGLGFAEEEVGGVKGEKARSAREGRHGALWRGENGGDGGWLW